MSNSFKKGSSRQLVRKDVPQNDSRTTGKATSQADTNQTASKSAPKKGGIKFNRGLNSLPSNKEHFGTITDFFGTKKENVYGIKIKLDGNKGVFSTTCFVNPEGYSPLNDFLTDLTEDGVSEVSFKDLIGLEVVFTTEFNDAFCNIATIALLEAEEDTGEEDNETEEVEDDDDEELERFFEEKEDE